MVMKHLVYIMAWALAACGQAEKKSAASKKKTGPLQVMAVNYPLRYFAERIGGAHVRVSLPVPGDADPADWMPEGGQLRGFVVRVQQADLILLNGAGYAKWIQHGTWREAQTVHTAGTIRDSLLEVSKEHRQAHKHGAGREHRHAGLAQTLWLNPRLAVRQAEAIRDAFARAKPDGKDVFAANFEKLRTDLESLGIGLPESTVPLLASHPVYQYLQSRFDLNIKSVHWEPGELPPAAAWEDLKKELKRRPADWMLWEGEPLPATTKKLRELGIEPIVFDPCGNVPSEGDYLSVMRANFANLQKALSKR
jgi:zinc transport system substrate-binding protein